MRRIGTLSDGPAAHRFCDYLLTLQIDAAVDESSTESGSQWEIWIRKEDDVERARAEWKQFRESPDAARYQVAKEAARVRDQRVADHQKRTQPHRRAADSAQASGRQASGRQPSGQRASGQPTLGSRGTPRLQQATIPVTIAIIAISVVASLTSHFGQPRGSRDPNTTTLEEKTYYGLSFVDRRDYVREGDPFASIKKGQWWRFITPMFLHGDEFHLAFNMLWIFFLGSAIERLHGSFFLLGLILITQTAGMMLQVMLPDASFLPESLRGSPFAIGASGAVYGLFGFLWIRPYVSPGYPVHLVPSNVVLMLGWLVICMTPMMGNVANGAHLGGLLAGVVAAAVGPLFRR